METPKALSERVTVLEHTVEAVVTRMGALETGLETLRTEVHGGFARVDVEFTQVRADMQSGFRALEYQINTTADRFETMLRESEQRIINSAGEQTQSAIQAAEQRIGGRTQSALQAAEQRIDERTQSALQAAEQRIDGQTQSALQAAEQRIDGRTQSALQVAEQRIDERTQSALQAAEQRIDDRTKAAIQTAIEAAEKRIDERMRAAIEAGDSETRRYMLTLHEDVIDRIKALSDGLRP